MHLLSGGQLVGSHVGLLVDEHPSLGIAGGIAVRCEVSGIHLPVLPVAARTLISVVSCGQPIVCGGDGLAGREHHPGRCTCAPFGLHIAVEEHAIAFALPVLIACKGCINHIQRTGCHVGSVQLKHGTHIADLSSQLVHTEDCIGHDIGVCSVGIGSVWCDGFIEVGTQHLLAFVTQTIVVIIVNLHSSHSLVK